MKSVFYRYLTKIVQLWHKFKIPSYTGSYYISPKTPYISQFIGIYSSSITINTLLTNKKHIKEFGAKNSKEFTFWSWRDCGIACIKMVLEAKYRSKNKTLMQLTKEGIKLGGYILYRDNKFVDEGWFHHSLVNLLHKYKVAAHIKKFQSIESVAKDILNNKMVILSVLVPGRRYIKEDGSFEPKSNTKFGGHLLLAIGVKMKRKEIEGVYAHDPRGLKNYQKNTFVPKKVFTKIFTNRSIVIS